MQIAATVVSSTSKHEVTVRTGETSQSLSVARKPAGPGSSVNGGEFLMLALATCYCNDLYREAQRLGIPIEGAEVEAIAEFPGIGLAASNISYRARVHSSAPLADVQRLLRETDAVAEVHNTIRTGARVELQDLHFATARSSSFETERSSRSQASVEDTHAATPITQPASAKGCASRLAPSSRLCERNNSPSGPPWHLSRRRSKPSSGERR